MARGILLWFATIALTGVLASDAPVVATIIGGENKFDPPTVQEVDYAKVSVVKNIDQNDPRIPKTVGPTEAPATAAPKPTPQPYVKPEFKDIDDCDYSCQKRKNATYVHATLTDPKNVRGKPSNDSKYVYAKFVDADGKPQTKRSPKDFVEPSYLPEEPKKAPRRARRSNQVQDETADSHRRLADGWVKPKTVEKLPPTPAPPTSAASRPKVVEVVTSSLDSYVSPTIVDDAAKQTKKHKIIISKETTDENGKSTTSVVASVPVFAKVSPSMVETPSKRRLNKRLARKN